MESHEFENPELESDPFETPPHEVRVVVRPATSTGNPVRGPARWLRLDVWGTALLSTRARVELHAAALVLGIVFAFELVAWTVLFHFVISADLAFDLFVAPGTDPASIRLVFDGVEAITVDEDGNLRLQTAAGDLLQRAPVLFQEGASGRVPRDGRFVLLDERTVGFAVTSHDPSRELVIDRVMALEDEEIDLDQLKWVVLMVLFNQPGRESAYAWMEDLVIDQVGERLN